MGDNDEATNALIAKMLSEDNAYDVPYADYADAGDQSDGGSDYGRPKKQRKKAPKGAAAKKAAGPKAAAAEAAAPSGAAAPSDAPNAEGEEQAGEVALSASGRRRRKDAGSNRKESRSWSEEEERLFLEALDLHGRDWKAGAAHVASRDSRAFASHAQKYFIKLCCAGKLLPAKVAESGPGYTLSGKLLDPHSAAARSYGLKPGIYQGLVASSAASLAGIDVNAQPPEEKENDAAGENGAAEASGAAEAQPSTAAGKKGAGSKGGAAAKKEPAAKKAAPKRKQRESDASEHQLEAGQLAVPEPTEYARNRPRREVAGPRTQLGSTSESLELLRCHDYVGPPGSKAPLAQPFQVEVAQQANLVMDFHAHLSQCEIIGLLGGTWDAEARLVRVAEAFPCKRAAGSHSGTSVELDAEAEVATRALMEQRGLVAVGWYHSHPIFEPRPSQKDAENQRNYQAMFRCNQSNTEPFLGAIVGPYDHQLPDERSRINWFVVQHKAGELAPYNIRYTVSGRGDMAGEEQVARLLQLLDDVAHDYGRVEFADTWRPFSRLVDGQPEGGPVSKLEKLRRALAAHLPDAPEQQPQVQACLDRLLSHLQHCWQLPGQQPAPQTAAVQADADGTAAPAAGNTLEQMAPVHVVAA